MAKELFSKDELVNCVLVDGDRRTDRTTFDPEKIELLKKCLIKRFNLLLSQFGAIWSAIKEAIYNKGRGIKHRRKLSFTSSA